MLTIAIGIGATTAIVSAVDAALLEPLRYQQPARRGNVRGMVLREALRVTGIGIALGLAGAVALSRVIASVAFHTNPLEPAVLTGVVSFVALVAALAA